MNNTFNVNAQNVGVVAETSNVQGGISQTATNHVQQAQDQLESLLTLLEKAGVDPKIKEGKQLAA